MIDSFPSRNESPSHVFESRISDSEYLSWRLDSVPNGRSFVKFGEVSCGVALYTAASTSDRITFNTINKATGNRVNPDLVLTYIHS